ncbi:MAG: hypothetical protein AMJ79_07895 [Phycisphaerae bacterium SM23_30]|nr:MAG: hypothetical protein AMJ79_07895 [Phycisphaerae bacterium SM23_30]
MLIQSGARRSHIENMVNEPQQIATVLVTVLLVEQDDNTTRVSFRSSGEVDVNKVARQFNGGGHASAAGATVNLPLDDARSRIINALTAVM